MPMQKGTPLEEDYLPSQNAENLVLPPIREEREAAEIGIIRELSPKKVLEQIRMNLNGFFWDYEQKKYIKLEGFEPLLNNKGVAKYLSIMSSVVTDLVTFSNYKEEEIPKLVVHICDKVIPVIHINYKEYGVKEKSDLEIIDVQIFNLTLAAFKKAIGAGDRGVIGRTISENILTRGIVGNAQFAPQINQGGFLSKINPFSRK